MGFGGLFRCICVGVYKEAFASKWSGTVPPETHLSTFQLLGSLGSRDSYRPVLVSEPSCCRDLHCAYVCINFSSNRLPPCSARERRKMRPNGTAWVHVSPLCVCLWSAWPPLHMHALVVCKCALCASAYCKYRLRLMTGWTQEHGAAAASPLSSYNFEHLPIKFSLKSRLKHIIASWFKLVLLILNGFNKWSSITGNVHCSSWRSLLHFHVQENQMEKIPLSD